ncbi:Integrase core domain [Actinobacillus indolicus]|nr:Integrase core domain [Actinobacillus indolicus]VFY94938.1 Integrase core domain [Actinobacillus indolicus]VTU06994.1 Integrase core domain [Actinobacillus indolicus]VTU07371.1 Integrase core domain [Actinobacillus indolicus]
MPWIETDAMQQRVLFIKAWLSRRHTKIELCKQFNISRPTADKWIKRHEQVGLEGLRELSRKPHHSPNAAPQWICEWLINEKIKRPHWGAKKLLDSFARHFPDVKKPADSTGDLILSRAGLVQPRKSKRRISADTELFSDCTAPNTVWSADFKGQFLLGNQKLCYPLTVTDNFSRYLFCCKGLPNTRSAPVMTEFERLFTAFGMPCAIRTDNGSPFASQALGGISKLSKWWIDLGIRPERIKPSHPEQNGRHERMHRSLKAQLSPQHSFEAQQAFFDQFLREYNEERSHEGIGRKTPVECYQPSIRTYTGKIEPYDYSDNVDVRKVRLNGEVKWQGKTYYLSQVLASEPVAFEPYADGIWHIYYRFHFLGIFDAREMKIKPATQWHIQPK